MPSHSCDFPSSTDPQDVYDAVREGARSIWNGRIDEAVDSNGWLHLLFQGNGVTVEEDIVVVGRAGSNVRLVTIVVSDAVGGGTVIWMAHCHANQALGGWPAPPLSGQEAQDALDSLDTILAF